MSTPSTDPSAPTPPPTTHARITRAHQGRREQLRAFARAIHADPELAFDEHRAVERCCNLLEEAGFEVERAAGGVPTAFVGRIGRGSLRAALCVEYDALPGVGHGCGHHLIAGASLGAGLALADVLDADTLTGLDLTVLVIGCPAEESGAGKQLLIDAGVFDGVHMAMMAHPTPHTDTYDPLGSTSQAVGRWRAEYTGVGAHAAANPQASVNANDAAVIAQVAAGLLRQRMLDGQRMALVPQQEGPTNIVPATAVLDVECRALTMPQFEALRDRLFDCLRAGAVATGCTLDIRPTEPVYEPLLQDDTLGAAWNDAMTELGRPLAGSLGIMAASTDMGNVSQRVPGLHPFVGIPGVTHALHTTDFATAAVSEDGMVWMEDMGLAMAWIVAAIAEDPARRAAVLAQAERLLAVRAELEQAAVASAEHEAPQTP